MTRASSSLAIPWPGEKLQQGQARGQDPRAGSNPEEASCQLLPYSRTHPCRTASQGAVWSVPYLDKGKALALLQDFSFQLPGQFQRGS